MVLETWHLNLIESNLSKTIAFWGEYRHLVEKWPLQSSQVKRIPHPPHPQDFIKEFIIPKLNPLVVVDFRFISAFLDAQFAVNSHGKQL